jgi:hypothetical protein
VERRPSAKSPGKDRLAWYYQLVNNAAIFGPEKNSFYRMVKPGGKCKRPEVQPCVPVSQGCSSHREPD